MYSPTWGRFLQADPSGYGAGANLYTYALNNPLSFTDPSGQTPDGSLAPDSIGSTISFTPDEVVVTAQRVYPQYPGLGTRWNDPTNLALGGAALAITGAWVLPEAVAGVVTTARLVQGLTVGASTVEGARQYQLLWPVLFRLASMRQRWAPLEPPMFSTRPSNSTLRRRPNWWPC